ncbi:MAG: type 1 glutamine amidotransferase [Stackebrandtia sp.]
MGTALVVENAPTWHLGRLEEWLTAADLKPSVVRPHRDEAIPLTADGHEALVALGGGRGAAWEPQLTNLLESAIADGVATLAFCSSARALAKRRGGRVAAVESFNPGPRLLAKRDAAGDDPLFGPAPMAIDVVAWRHEELTDLPPEAVLLAASPHGAPDVFRVGERFWGVQSHVEFDADMVTGLDGSPQLADRVAAVGEHLRETWRPIVERLGRVAHGKRGGAPLPLLDQPR